MASQTDKKEEFRKYLEKGNVLAILTNILTDLFEMDVKPEDPGQYLYQRFGDSLKKDSSVPASQIDTPQPEPQKDTTMQDVVPPSAPRPSLPTAPISNVEQPRTASLPPAPNAQAKVPAMGQTSALYTPLPESIYENASATPGQPARAPPAVKVDQTLVNSIPTPPATQAMAPTQPPAPPLPSDPTAAAQPTVVIPTSNPAPVQ